jgi:hypothetical protein
LRSVPLFPESLPWPFKPYEGEQQKPWGTG